MVKKIKVISLVEDELPKTEAEELNTIIEEMAIVEPMEPVIMKKKNKT